MCQKIKILVDPDNNLKNDLSERHVGSIYGTQCGKCYAPCVPPPLSPALAPYSS